MSWYENLQKDEVPPEHLWEDAEGLEMWWATVEEKREDSMSGDSGSSSSESDQGSGMAENDLARSLKAG